MSGTLQRLQHATLRLTQDGSIKERLADAFVSHLAGIDPLSLPEEARAEFRELDAAMHRESPLPRENPIQASVRKMSIPDARRYAAVVVRIFAAVACTQFAAAPVHRAPRAASKAAPQPHLLS